MTDKELAQRLTGALDERIARASAAPVARERMNHMPAADDLTSSQVKAIPVKQLRWKNAIAAVLVVGMLGGIGLAASKLLDRTKQPQTGESGNSEITQTTEPLPEDELPVVSFEEDTKTLRVVGTGHYDRIDLSRLPDASHVIVEDDDWEYRIQTAVLWNSESDIDDPVSYLPGYLERVDKSLATIRKFVADNAPNEDVLAQTQKRVKLSWDSLRSGYISNDDTVNLILNHDFRWVGACYVQGLTNPDWSTPEWIHVVFQYWIDWCRNPYCPMFWDYPELYGDTDYYRSLYFQFGGTADLRDVNSRILCNDFVSWRNLVSGKDWSSHPNQSGQLTDILSTLDASKEENRMSLCEAMSLLNYLAEQHGEDKVVAYCFDTCTFEEAFGTDFASARAAWEQSLLDRFGDGSETPTEPAALPQVEYDEQTKTLHITGTEGYDQLDLSQAANAKKVEVEDDDYRLTFSVDQIKYQFDKGGDAAELAAYLPGYLERLGKSISFIRQFIVDNAPNAEIVAQTEKPVSVEVQYVKERINSADQITLRLGNEFYQHGYYYVSALMNSKKTEWQHMGFAYWVGTNLDPYNSLYDTATKENYDIDYYYFEAYYRAGGTGRFADPKEARLVTDANAWYNLTHGQDWPGTRMERGPLYDLIVGADKQKEGNDMSLPEAMSLINYLAQQYGTDKVVAYCFDTCTFEEAFGTDFASARATWEQSLLDRFGDGSDENAELPQVSYDADSRTVRITGTTGYDRLDLSPWLDDALNLEVEDDSFRLRVVLSVVENYADQANLNLADYLPGYLDRLDHSLAFVGQYVAEHAPKEEPVENTRKPVDVMVTGLQNRFSGVHSDKVTLSLASYFRHHGIFYTLALMNPETVEWQQLGYAYWVGLQKDPYNSIYAVGSFDDDFDYFYMKDYARLGGTSDPRDLNNQALIHDANAWYNLVYGRDWGGNIAECRAISDIGEFHGFTGDPEKEGNDLCMVEAVSLINYLAEQYGEEQVAAFCFDTCTFEEAFGTDFTSARAAWEQSLLDRFGDGSENP